MATTTNFGWTTPDDTDLVKDGAAAIRTLGSSIDTSLVDLKGGTTGQVLAKASGTDMDFNWVADAGFANPMTTTADLIYSSSGSTPARLGIGTAGQVLAVNSGATAPEWVTPAASTPSFVGCYLQKTTDQTISSNTITVVTFTSETIDTDGFHDNVTNTGRITIPSGKGGKYLIGGTLTYNGNATGQRQLIFAKNGSEISYASSGSTAQAQTLHKTMIVDLIATDFITLNAYSTTGIDVSSNASDVDRTAFYAYFLGA